LTYFELERETSMRLYEHDDLPQLYSVVIDNLDHLHTYLAWARPDYSRETAAEFIARSRRDAAEGKNLTLGIFRNAVLAGSVGFVSFARHSKRAEIGYWISKHFERQGIITAACRKLIIHGFNSLGLHRIEIRCAVENVRSRAVPERLGFTLEGIIRQSEWRHTKFHDMAVYGLLRSEWNN
jgi:ribosomal-protein-serine acetyltransferase